MNLRNVFLIYIWFFTYSIYGQKANDNANLLLLSVDYASNTNTFGVTNPVKQPLYINTLSFLSKYNFDISYSGIVADNSDSTYTKATFEHSLSAGYTFEMGEKWSIYPSYSHLFHSKNTYTLASSFSDIIQNDLSYIGNYYTLNLTTNFILGKRNMFFCSLENAVNYTIDEFLTKNSMLTFQLGLYLNISDNNYYNEYFFNDFDIEYFLDWSIENFSFRDLLIIRERLLLNGLEDSKSYVKEEFSDLFTPDYKLTSIDIYLPVYYSVNNFMFSLTGILNIPTCENPFFQIDNSFLISIGLSYGFEL